MASAKNSQLISSQGPHFSPCSTAKTTVKVQISGRMASISINKTLGRALDPRANGAW